MSVTFKFLPFCAFPAHIFMQLFSSKNAEGGNSFDKSKYNLDYVIGPLIILLNIILMDNLPIFVENLLTRVFNNFRQKISFSSFM